LTIGLAIRLASLCCATALLGAACGGGSSPQPDLDYGLKANAICLTLAAETAGSPATAAGLTKNVAALDTALSGLEKLVPPTDGDKPYYLDLVAKFKAADELFKIDLPQFIQLQKKLSAHPNDKAAQKKFNKLAAPVASNLSAAATDAHKLGMGKCEVAFSGGPNG
jgi:hypothetical protein